MSHSPGHQKFPDHHVREDRIPRRVTATIAGETIADSTDAIRVDEDEMPARWYFPRADVAMSRLEHTETTTECPFKGKASYFTLKLTGKTLPDTAWSYEDPYDEHRALQGRVAFWEEKIPGIQVRTV